MHGVPSSWNNRLRLPGLLAGHRLLDGYDGFLSFARREHGTILRQLPLRGGSSLIVGKPSYRSPQFTLSQSMPGKSFGGVETRQGFSISNSRSWVLDRGVGLSNVRAFSDHLPTTPSSQILVANAHFAVEPTVAGLSQPSGRVLLLL